MHRVQLNDMGVDGGFGRGGDKEVLELAMHDGFASGVVVAVVIMFVRWHWLGDCGNAWCRMGHSWQFGTKQKVLEVHGSMEGKQWKSPWWCRLEEHMVEAENGDGRQWGRRVW